MPGTITTRMIQWKQVVFLEYPQMSITIAKFGNPVWKALLTLN